MSAVWGKVAPVAGGSRRIGAAIFRALAKDVLHFARTGTIIVRPIITKGVPNEEMAMQRVRLHL